MPDWLYERLPALYLAAAAACLWMLGVSFSTASSALMLLAAALRTRSLRRRARQPVPARAARPSGPRPALPADRQGTRRPRAAMKSR